MDQFAFHPVWEAQQALHGKRRHPETVQAARMVKVGCSPAACSMVQAHPAVLTSVC